MIEGIITHGHRREIKSKRVRREWEKGGQTDPLRDH